MCDGERVVGLLTEIRDLLAAQQQRPPRERLPLLPDPVVPDGDRTEVTGD